MNLSPAFTNQIIADIRKELLISGTSSSRFDGDRKRKNSRRRHIFVLVKHELNCIFNFMRKGWAVLGIKVRTLKVKIKRTHWHLYTISASTSTIRNHSTEETVKIFEGNCDRTIYPLLTIVLQPKITCL